METPSLCSSVGTGSVPELRTGCRWFETRLSQYTFRELVIVIHSTSTAVHCFDDGYVEKQRVGWKEYYGAY